MNPKNKPTGRRASNNTADPLEEALRQMGADMLDEPVPERLRQVLRRARGDSEPEPDSEDESSQGADRRR